MSRSNKKRVNKVDVYLRDSADDYKNKRLDDPPRETIDVSLEDLMHYSIVNGGFNGRVIKSREGLRFYSSIVPFALKSKALNERRLLQQEDYAKAESSFKSATSFYLGMIAAQVVFDKVIRTQGSTDTYLLLHAKDKRFELGTSKSNLHPDFIGLRNDIPFVIIEAKGTSGTGKICDSVEKACDQLQNISSVTNINVGKNAFSIDNKHKHVITSGFTRSSNGEAVLTLTDINLKNNSPCNARHLFVALENSELDGPKYPRSEEPVDIEFDQNAAVKSYYANAMELISRFDQTDQPIGSTNYITVRFDGITFGIAKSLKNTLEQKTDDLSKAVFGQLAELPDPEKASEEFTTFDDGTTIKLDEEFYESFFKD